MKPRSTRYFRLSLGPRKPVLERRRHEDDGWMNEQMTQQTDDQNYRLRWREGKNWGMAEVRWTGQIHRYVGRVEKGSEESRLLLRTLDQSRCILRSHVRTPVLPCRRPQSVLFDTCFLPRAPDCVGWWFQDQAIVLEIFQVSFNTSRCPQ